LDDAVTQAVWSTWAPDHLPSIFMRPDGPDIDLLIHMERGEATLSFLMQHKKLPDTPDPVYPCEGFWQAFIGHLVQQTVRTHGDELERHDAASVLVALSNRAVSAPRFQLEMAENGRMAYTMPVPDDGLLYRFEFIPGLPAWTYSATKVR
jgi:hypothetical protein